MAHLIFCLVVRPANFLVDYSHNSGIHNLSKTIEAMSKFQAPEERHAALYSLTTD
jgi:hypothetical protein